MLKKNRDHYRNFLPLQKSFEVTKGPLKGNNYLLSQPQLATYQTKAHELTFTNQGLKIIFDHFAGFLGPKRPIFTTLGYIRPLVGLTTKFSSQKFFHLMSRPIFREKIFDDTIVSVGKDRKFRKFAFFACATWCDISNESLWAEFTSNNLKIILIVWLDFLAYLDPISPISTPSGHWWIKRQNFSRENCFT